MYMIELAGNKTQLTASGTNPVCVVCVCVCVCVCGVCVYVCVWCGRVCVYKCTVGGSVAGKNASVFVHVHVPNELKTVSYSIPAV